MEVTAHSLTHVPLSASRAVRSWCVRPWRNDGDPTGGAYWISILSTLIVTVAALGMWSLTASGVDSRLWIIFASWLVSSTVVVEIAGKTPFTFGEMFLVVGCVVLPVDQAGILILLVAAAGTWFGSSWNEVIWGLWCDVMCVSLILAAAKGALAVMSASPLAEAGVAALSGCLGLMLYNEVLWPVGKLLGQGRSWLGSDAYRPDVVFVTLVTLGVEAPLAIVASSTFHQVPWTLPLLAITYVFFARMIRRERNVSRRLAGMVTRFAQSSAQFAAAMVRALDARDAYTAGHSAAVAVYARDIAVAAGLDEITCQRAHLAGLLHDIGKIGIRGDILNKQGPLTDTEYGEMKRHAEIGADILLEVEQYREIAGIVRHHHERFDGAGYPHKLSGVEIPIISRILMVADTYSALTTDRSYRQGMAPAEAIKIVIGGAGTQFDPLFVDAFVQVFEQGDDFYRRGHQTDFGVEFARHQLSGDIGRVHEIIGDMDIEAA